MKKIIYIILGYFSLFFINSCSQGGGGNYPKILKEVDEALPSNGVSPSRVADKIGGELISSMIKYVAVIAVIALMISGVMYILSNGEEEKVKKAKTWIIWSLIAVILSISAKGIIQLINNINI